MGEKKLEAGEFVYREGDTSDAIYIVVSGQIEILEASDGRDIQIGTVAAGKAFGELAVFDASALRPHSARVLEASVLTSMTSEEFQSQFAQCPKSIQPIIQLAFDKMKAIKVKSKLSMAEAVLENDITKVTITPASDALKSQFKPIEVPIIRLPFRIGGYPESGQANRRDQVHLSLASQDNPLKISRQHCEIAIDNKALVINDLGSRFCTKVNDTIIGRGRGTYIAPLKKGANEITLGAADSPYKVTVTCA
jgi:hypothetical protein